MHLVRRNEERFRLLLQTASDGVVTVDERQRIVLINDVACEMFGHSRDEILGDSLERLLPKRHHAAHSGHVESFGGETPRRRMMGDRRGLVGVRSSGEEFPVDIAISELEIDGERLFTAVVRDITSQLEAEEQLRKNARELEFRNKIAATPFITMSDDDTYSRILEVLLEAFESRYGVFGYIDEAGAFVVPTMTRHVWDQCEVPDKAWVFPREGWGDSIWPRAISERKILHSNERSRLTPEGHVTIDRNITAPVIHRGEVVGLFQVANKDSDYDDDDLSLAQALAETIAPILAGRLAHGREEARRVQSETELRSSEATNRALLDAMPDLVFRCAPNGAILDYHNDNTGAAPGNASDLAHVTGRQITPDVLLGQTLADVFPPGLTQEISAAIAMALETGLLQTFECQTPVGNRKQDWEMRISQLEGRPELLVLARDITEHVQARQELENLVRSKNGFIATVSHELRTPLTGVLGYAHLLRSGGDDLTSEDRRQMIEVLVEQSSDLNGIVEDLLVMARDDLGQLDVARVNTSLRAQAAQVLETWGPAAASHIELSGPHVTGMGDPARVRQVIRNLIINALRHGGPRIRITTATDETTATLQVSDNGNGLLSEDVERLFKPYEKANDKPGRTGSLGLGLFISQRLARCMGGDLTYRRQDSESIFELTLPSAQHVESDAMNHSERVTARNLERDDGREAYTDGEQLSEALLA